MLPNVQTLIDKIQAKLDASNAYDSEEVVALALSMIGVQQNNIITIPNLDALPDLLLVTIADGSIYFVESNLIHVIKVGLRWITFDGVTAREYIPSSEVYSWGSNITGQLGDSTAVNKSSPVSVVGGFTDWSLVSAARYHSLGLRSNGTAWAWGYNSGGQLGDGTVYGTSSPVSVIGGFTDWIQVSAGGSHSLGLRSNSTIWAWGRNLGRLGDGTGYGAYSPVSVIGGFTDWIQVSAGGAHSLGLRSNGTIWAWGYNYGSQLGDGTSVTKNSPVSVVGGFTDWSQVSAGSDHSLGLRSNGTAWAWGFNPEGRLGDGTTTNRSSPVSVVGGFTDWCQVSAGGSISLGLRTNGTIWAWGGNIFGAVGDGTTTNRCSPVSVVGGFTDWCQVSAGGFHGLGLRSNGTTWAWGFNASGQLGNDTTITRSSPVSVVGGFTNWCQVSAGYNHSLGIKLQ